MRFATRHIAVYLTFLSILLSAQGGVLARVVFEIRQDHIAAHHCENRFDPHSKCNGICFLKKQLNEQHEHEPEKQAQVPVSLVTFFLVAESAVELMPPVALADFPPAAEAFVPRPAQSEIYHPPRMA